MTVPYSFGSATSAIPLSQLDSNFNTPITLGNTAIQLGNTVTTLNNMTLANVTVSSGTISLTDITASGNVTLSGGTSNGVAYLNGSKVVTTGSALTFDGTNFNVVRSAATDQYMSLYADGTGPTFKFFGGAAGKIALLVADSASARMQFQNDGDKPFVYSINGSEQMRLTSTGLGIGTSSPTDSQGFGKALDISSASYGGALYIRSSASASTYGWFGYDYTALASTIAAYGTNTKLQFNAGTGAVKMTLDSSGRLGIGVTSPTRVLDISAATAISFLTSSTGTNTSYYAASNTGGGFYFGRENSAGTTFGTAVAYASAVWSEGAYPMVFATNNAEKMRLDSSGNLGLGVTPSAWSGFKAFQTTGGAHFFGNAGAFAQVGANAYWDGSNYIYVTSAQSSRYLQNAGVHSWHVASSGTAGNAITFTQAMTLTAAGRLGLGLTSPSTLFEAYGGAAGTSSELTVGNASTAARFGVDTSNEVTVATGQAVPIKFLTSNTERARFTSAGYFKASNTGGYVSSTSTYHELRNDANTNTVRISNSIASGYTDAITQITFTGYTPNDGTAVFLWCNDASAVRAKILSNGGLANYSANNVNLSDRREKTNFAPAGEYLSKICAIPVQTFNYIDQNLEEDDGLTLGVVAQDVQAIAPELVTESNLGTEEEPKMRLSIYQTDLQYALMKCIQEQQTLITQLTERITALESK